jgi:hypothetical protein
VRSLQSHSDRASSWSWASVDGEISFLPLHIGRRHIIGSKGLPLHVDCGCGSSRNEFKHSGCTAGTITMECPVADGLVVGHQNQIRVFDFMPDDFPMPDVLLSPPPASRLVGYAVFDTDIVPTDFICVQVAYVSQEGRRRPKTRPCVLILQKSSHNSSYTRRGIGYNTDGKTFTGMRTQILTIA